MLSAKDVKPAATKVRLRDFSRSLPMALLRAREGVMRHFRVSLRQHDLTEQQWRVLRALSSVGEIEIADLARSTFLLGPSLSRILRDLEPRGLISRRTPASDQRRSLIAIAPAGLALMEQIAPQSEAIYAEITRRFGADRLAQLQDMLRDLEREMTAFVPIDTDGDSA
jgi:homoprotocatechuate degradation regulator HpaR